MASLPTFPIAQTSEAMVPTSDQAKHQTPSTSGTSTGAQGVDMGPYQKSPQSNPLANHPALDLNVHNQPLHSGIQPPQLRTPLASEPADQWASPTIDAVTDETRPPASNVSTPGVQFPGAYPSLLPSKDTVQHDLEYARNVATSAFTTAGDTVKSAGATAAQYLPPAIASYLPGFPAGNSQTDSHSTAIADPTGNMMNGLEGLRGTSFAKLPEETRVANEFHYQSTTAADPTGNSMNGLEGLSGQSLAKLPGERLDEAKPTPYAPETHPKTFSAAYLNPIVVPDSSVNPTALPSRNAPDDLLAAPPRHQLPQPSGSQRPSEASGADTDASTMSLAGTTHADSVATAFTTGTPAQQSREKEVEPRSMYRESDSHRGTFENKPLHESVRPKVDPHIETLREHDAAKKGANAKVTDTIVSSVKDEERKLKKAFDRHAGTGESKPVHESFRNVSTEGHAPPVPQKDVNPATGAALTTGTREPSIGSPTTTTNRTSKGSFGSEDSAGRKTGFMSKMKGEMKVLSGKLTNKEEKIEEGRRLMGKN